MLIDKKDLLKIKRAQAYKDNIVVEKERRAKYYQRNRLKIIARTSAYAKVYRKKPEIRLKFLEIGRAYKKECLNSWIGFIPQKTNCQCCGKQIFFASKNTNTSIHFDHRKDTALHIVSPTNWLGSNKRNPKTELLWKSFDFGMLCRRCNAILPTENRIEFLKKALKYAEGI